MLPPQMVVTYQYQLRGDKEMKATLNFANLEIATAFIRAWALRTLKGHDRSAMKEDGTFDVTVYDVTESEKEFIVDYANKLND